MNVGNGHSKEIHTHTHTHTTLKESMWTKYVSRTNNVCLFARLLACVLAICMSQARPAV